MRNSLRRHERLKPAVEPMRDGEGATVISLATRNAMPAVTQRKGGSEALGVAGGVAVVGLLGALTLWSLNGSQKARAPAAPAASPSQPGPGPIEVAPAVPPQAVTLPGQAPLPTPAAPAPQPQVGALPAGNPLSTPTVVFDASALPAPAASPAAGAAAATGAAGSNDDFAARIGGVGGSTTVATAGINPQTTVTQGTLIPAVLETAIDTDVPGYVRAVVSSDVRGFDGTRVMIPRSSRLIGQYKSGMQAGQKRAYVVWTRVIRPDGVSVNIASPAIAFGGETGLGGQVDNHFFERFGSSMLLSVIGGLSAIGGNGASVVIGGQTQSAAAAAVSQGAQIGPTVRVRQGEPIRVFTARDLDFSRVATQ
jgi:type IV secretion system protein VirB10